MRLSFASVFLLSARLACLSLISDRLVSPRYHCVAVYAVVGSRTDQICNSPEQLHKQIVRRQSANKPFSQSGRETMSGDFLSEKPTYTSFRRRPNSKITVCNTSAPPKSPTTSEMSGQDHGYTHASG